MTPEEITAMAEKAGFSPSDMNDGRAERLDRFAALVAEKAAAKEREAIAAHYAAQPHVEFFGSELADEIRALGQKGGV